MDKKITIPIIIIIIAAVICSTYYYTNIYNCNTTNTTSTDYWENENGTVTKFILGNNTSDTELVLIAGIHPRETLAIEPEIEAARQFSESHDVKFIVYQVNVTKNPIEYQPSRDQGEGLVHDFVVPDINNTNAGAVIISHSHIESYGEGYYLATPEMDNASANISETITNSSDFGYYPRNTSQPVEATSAILVSKPIASAGYPTFVYEIPENITEQNSTNKTFELFELMYNIVKK